MTDTTQEARTHIEAGDYITHPAHDGLGLVTETTARTITAGWDGPDGEHHKHKRGECEIALRPEDVPADEATPDDDEELTPGQRMSKTISRYRSGYKPTTTARGTKSLNNGDAIAEALAGLEPDVVALIADRVKGEADGHHAERYARLNPGQIRMNSGNRIRAHAKIGEPEAADVMRIINEITGR